MIKLPKKTVIYPQKRNKPDYLLCWIPADGYEKVAISQDMKEELETGYPNGLEIELSQDGLEEFGIQFEYSPDELRAAYLELNEQNVLPESGMVEVEALEGYIRERSGGRSIEEIMQPSPPEGLSFEVGEDEPLQNLKEGPEMVGEEDPQDLFQRLAVRQVKSPKEQGGEE